MALAYLGFEADSGWRALESTAYMTAKPASKEIGAFAAVVVVTGLLALLTRLRLRLLAPIVALVVLAAVILATAIVGGRALAMVDAALSMLAIWFTGERLLIALHLPQLARRRVVAWASGIGPLLLLSIVLGRLSIFRWWDMGILVVALGLAGAVNAARALIRGRAELVAAVTESAVSAASAAALLLTAAVASIYTAAPEIQYDPLYGKAYLPMLWARTGHIGAVDSHVQLAITGWFQVVAAWGNLLGAGATGRYLQLSAFIVLPIAIWSFARDRGLLAPLAAAAVGLIPMLFWQATTADDDILIALGALGIILAAWVAMQPDFEGRDRATGLALGLLAGTGWSMKTHVIPLATVLVAGWALSARGTARRLSRVGWGALGLVVTAAPPIVLRWIDTGNPIFPSYNNIFKSPYWLPVNEAFNFPFWPRPGVLGALRAPVDAVFNPGIMGESLSPGGFGAFAGLTLVALLVGWHWRKRVPGSFVLWVALVIATIVWWKEFRYLRYYLPEGVLATVLLVSAAPRIAFPRRLPAQAGLVACVAIAAVSYLCVSVADLWNVPNKRVPVNAALGRWSANAYLTTMAPERTAILAFNRLSPPHAVMLTSAFERAWLTAGRDLYEPWETTDLAVAHHTPPDSLAHSLAALHRLGIGWVLTDPSDGDIGAVSPNEHGVESDWLAPVLARNGSVRYAANGWTLFKLAAHPRASRPFAACDRTGRPGFAASCWQGTRNAAGQIAGTAVRTVKVCPGEILDLKVTQAAGHPPEAVSVALPQQPSYQQFSAGPTIPGATADVYETVLPGDSEAVVAVNNPAAAGIGAARLDVIGNCAARR